MAAKASVEREQASRLQHLEQSRHEMAHFVRSLSHDMTAMFMLLDHSFQRLKDAATPIAVKAVVAPEQPASIAPQPSAGDIGPLTQRFAHVEACCANRSDFWTI